MIFFSGNVERTLIVTTDMRFLIVSNFYTAYLPLKTRHLSILLHEWRIWEYITKLHVSIRDSNKLDHWIFAINYFLKIWDRNFTPIQTW